MTDPDQPAERMYQRVAGLRLPVLTVAEVAAAHDFVKQQQPPPSGRRVITQWGVQLTWPDGHSEVQECASRSEAEGVIRSVGLNPSAKATATLAVQTVTHSGCAPVAS